MRPSGPLRAVGFLMVLGLAAGCGGGGGGGSSVDPNAPVIANLRVTFGSRCTLASGQPGTLELLAFDYTDADGNLRGGTLENTTTANAGGSMTFTPPIPSSDVVISGTTSGTIGIGFCTRFGSNATITEQVRIADASGKISNTLSLVVSRPEGAPLLPQDADPAFRKSL